MPIIKSAKKKLRQDKKRYQQNISFKIKVKKAVRTARIDASPKNIQIAYSVLDTAAKKHILHPNAAARFKSRLARGKINPPAGGQNSTLR